MLPELYVLRHGETHWNAARRIQGQHESRLNDRGHAQAAGMARSLAAQGVTGATHALRSSPLIRARETAEHVASAMGVTGPVATDDDLKELYMGDWQTLMYDDLIAQGTGPRAGDSHLDWCLRAPGGERLDAFWDRAGRVLERIEGPTVLVCHGLLSRVLRTQAMGWGPDRLDELPGRQGDVYRIRDGIHSVVSSNE
ncbi:histidine phosphatase family protein [Maritimibacter sp. UBA3975]|uniref:histidine phosphatase family protein n=1 Tax=Maritimibacter sp. UBA3975 TaxID=1946833 RepID=UPI000C0BB74D|nr:histidine phosphatase family protein [Maritimibacter sp. UBA3975]MAM60142.1 histidine phosphatase family protein [Maritimibacter sp.]|tara:strand:+ start:40859 stop:41449 length:591 start_codon:yes stop_codon:yes gene_type:complete